MTTATLTEQPTEPTIPDLNALPPVTPTYRGTTRSGLPRLQSRPLIEAGKRQVDEALKPFEDAAMADPGDVEVWRAYLVAASRVLHDVDAELDGGDERPGVRDRRNRAMLSLSVHDGVKHVSGAAGMSTSTFYDMRLDALGIQQGDLAKLTTKQQAARLRRRGYRKVPDALDVLTETAPRSWVLDGRRSAAVEQQRRAALGAHTAGMHARQVAELMGRAESRFWLWHAAEQKTRRDARGKQ